MDAELSGPPSLKSLYAKAVLRRGGDPARLPADRLLLADQPIDTDRLRRYQQVCGYRVGDVLPPAYLHLMAFPLSMALMTRPDFPFPLLGLVHVENELHQLRPVRSGERVSVRCWAQNLREHSAGRAVDLVSEASVGGEPVWREVSGYLHRERSGSGGKHDRPAPIPGPVVRIRVPSDTGRRYAAVSGDRNPIHLHDLTAKLFGFRSAIAHGMWLQARTLAAFEGRLPERLTATASFKTPVFLPSTVELRAAPDGVGWRDTDSSWRYAVTGVRSGKPHLAGTIQPA